MIESTLTKHEIISIVSERFETNPRIQSLFDSSKKKYPSNVKMLVDYCYTIAYRLNGVKVSSNKKTIIFCYIKSEFKQTFMDLWKYFAIILSSKISKLWCNLRLEIAIKNSRLKLDDYLYVWFLAQEKGYGKLDGLIEIQKFLFSHAHQKGLSILIETSNVDVVKLYLRATFQIYNTLTINNETIYFLHADKETITDFMAKNEVLL